MNVVFLKIIMLVLVVCTKTSPRAYYIANKRCCAMSGSDKLSQALLQVMSLNGPGLPEPGLVNDTLVAVANAHAINKLMQQCAMQNTS